MFICPYLLFLHSQIDFSLLHSSTHIWDHETQAFEFLEDPITSGNRWDLVNQDIRSFGKTFHGKVGNTFSEL